MEKHISVYGARVNNLKNIDVTIPAKSLTVVTGLSGSGKSSLAFDTIYAEGQRRYIDTFSAYARSFLGGSERPDVDKITGLSPVISIEQKTTNRNPRSTVGTTTEIYDFMRLLYARVATPFDPETGEEIVQHTEESIIGEIRSHYDGKRIYVLAPVVHQRKGHYRELFESLMHKGYMRALVDGEMKDIVRGMRVDRYKMHNIEVVVDRFTISEANAGRLADSVATALRLGDGAVEVLLVPTDDKKETPETAEPPITHFQLSTTHYRLSPNFFSFNSPEGACPRCKGLGYVNEIDRNKIIADPKLSVHDGGITPLGRYRNQLIFWQIDAILQKHGCSLKTPVGDIPDDTLNELLYGVLGNVRVDKDVARTSSDYFAPYDGIVKYIRTAIDIDDSEQTQRWAERFLRETTCPECHGARLKPDTLTYRIHEKNIAQAANLDIAQLRQWLDEAEASLPSRRKAIAREILKEIRSRLGVLLDVGLDYLSLSRSSASLSGGESQRIRLATQIGSQLVNVLYILDEPSIGLHQRDNKRLIASLKKLRDMGNTVIVVEHDRDMMLAADYLVDIGPRAGRLGGEVVFQGKPSDIGSAEGLTAAYIKGTATIPVPTHRRPGNGRSLVVRGAKGNNLQGITATFPLGCLIVVTGVSGSGKSTLVNETLQPALSKHLYRSLKQPLPHDTIEGMEYVDKVVSVDQAPIGRTPRSNPATYTGVFGDIRALFVGLPEAKIRGYKPGRFSFNVKGGRCEACSGNGYRTIEMNFLPNVTVPCDVCHGKRYNRETLEVRYKGKSIADVLDMTIDEAIDFFQNIPTIRHKIQTLHDVGLGYVRLGQPSTTLSGGESQRVKLATELARHDTGQTVYILDEPTTGLHFEDIKMLLAVLNTLVERGNTVIIIEHNMDVIKQADYIIDMGPEGGRNGGRILAAGTPEEIARIGVGYTSKFLREELSHK